MHLEALQFIQKSFKRIVPFKEPDAYILEFGSKNINGSPKDVIQDQYESLYYGIDIADGNDVDTIADAAEYKFDKKVDVIICAEVLEHTSKARQIIINASRNLLSSQKNFGHSYGFFIATMAGVDRKPHSAIDGGPLRLGEHYKNISLPELEEWVEAADLWIIDIICRDGEDIYLLACTNEIAIESWIFNKDSQSLGEENESTVENNEDTPEAVFIDVSDSIKSKDSP